MGADLLDGDVELTEFEAIDVESIKGVGKGANGFPHLLMKGLADAEAPAADPDPEPDPEPDDGVGVTPDAATLVTAAIGKAVTDGKVDEAPDIDLGQQVMRLLGQAIGNEAQEIVAGSYGETTDVTMLTRAADLVSCWIAREQAVADGKDPNAPCGCCAWCDGIGCGCCTDCGAGSVMCAAAEKALLSGKEKNDLPDSAFAYIEDGGKKDADGKTTPRSLRHFPIHDKAHADNAAARIAQGAKFGDQAKRKVTAAQKKFGSDTDGGAGKSVADGVTDVDTVTENDAVAKALEASEARLTALEERDKEREDELAKAQAAIARFEAMPRPGGPVMSVTRPPTAGADGETYTAKAARFEALALQMSDPADADGYRKLARQAREKATAAT